MIRFFIMCNVILCTISLMSMDYKDRYKHKVKPLSYITKKSTKRTFLRRQLAQNTALINEPALKPIRIQLTKLKVIYANVIKIQKEQAELLIDRERCPAEKRALIIDNQHRLVAMQNDIQRTIGKISNQTNIPVFYRSATERLSLYLLIGINSEMIANTRRMFVKYPTPEELRKYPNKNTRLEYMLERKKNLRERDLNA